jgi:signal transduction histidine kinase
MDPSHYDRRVSLPEESLAGLLKRVVNRVEEGAATEERLRALLDAVTAVGSDLDLPGTLTRIVTAAARLSDAKYGALGVVDSSGEGLVEFVTYGIDGAGMAKIGSLPRGHGILGLLITDPRPLRLHDLKGHASSYGFPANHPPMSSFLGVPIRVRDRVFGNLYLTEKRGGGDFTDADEQAVIALAAAAAVSVENAALYGESQRRSRWLGATAEIQRTLLAVPVTADALDLVASHARSVTEGDLAIVVLEDPSGELVIEAVSGTDQELIGGRLPREGVWQDVVEHGATIHLAEGVRVPGLPGIESALMVPFRGTDSTGGAILVSTSGKEMQQAPQTDEVAALRGFASQAAIALQLAKAREDRESLAIFADRDRIARDLHDVVIQRLFATGLTLQGLARHIGDPALAGRLANAVNDLDTTIRDIRTTIFELSSNDSVSDLKAQVAEVVGAAQSTLKLKPQLRFEGPVDTLVPDEIRPHLIAVLVEALSNVGRHAHASSVHVVLAARDSPDNCVELIVRDDGVGMPDERAESGLANMRRRAKDLGGDLRIESRPNAGTTLTWSSPI